MKIKNVFSMIGKIILIISIITSVYIVILLNSPIIKNRNYVIISFLHGTTVKTLLSDLNKKNIIQHPLLFGILIHLSGFDRYLKAGEYIIYPYITTPLTLFKKMITGDAIYHSFTIIEGSDFFKIIDDLNKNHYIKHLLQGLNPDQIMHKIGHPNEHYEGKFAPDTYLFSGETSDIDILTRAFNLMNKHLHQAWSNRDNNLTYKNPYQVLIAASIIEKETCIPKEKNIISRVILHRLKANMLLQIDPTVIYGIKNFSGKLTKKDLTKNTIYNTYLHKGLPPTPISMPSKETINATVHPDKKSTAYYYVAKGDGTHEFSVNFIQHTKAVNKYVMKR